MSSIDIVIPCYKYGRYLCECVQSVLNQGVADCRILIIDDASPDETPQVAAALVSADSRVSYLRHTQNLGHISTYNEGIAWCRSDYMLLLSADDYLLAAALKRAMHLLDAHPDMGLCFGEALETDGDAVRQWRVDTDFSGGDSAVLSGAEFVRLCVAANARDVVPTPTAVVRTALLKRLGGYRPELPHSADMELWLRLATHAPVGVVRANQAVYRRHAGNMSSDYNANNRLSDLLQRQAAVDAFLGISADVLPQARFLHGQLLQGLSREALSEADSALCQDQPSRFQTLCDLALKLDPDVKLGAQWHSLASRETVRTPAARALRSADPRKRRQAIAIAT